MAYEPIFALRILLFIFEPTALARAFRDTALLHTGSIGTEAPQQSAVMSIMEFVLALWHSVKHVHQAFVETLY